MARNTSLPDTIPRPRMRFHLIFDLTGDFGNSKNGVIWTSGDSVKRKTNPTTEARRHGDTRSGERNPNTYLSRIYANDRGSGIASDAKPPELKSKTFCRRSAQIAKTKDSTTDDTDRNPVIR